MDREGFRGLLERRKLSDEKIEVFDFNRRTV